MRRPEHLRDPRWGEADHVAIGYGNREFYLNTPTWADLSLKTAALALFGRGTTLLHVEHIDRPRAEEWQRPIRISPAQYRRLAGFIQRRFRLDRGGRPIPVLGRGYAGYDMFYEANGGYSFVMTCNEWTGRALRAGRRPHGPVDAVRAKHHVAARLSARACARKAVTIQIGGRAMAKILGNFHLALLIGIILLIAAMFGLHREASDPILLGTVAPLLHVLAGILWIGLLYYFNFVQIPTMPTVPAELKPGITKYIAPAALFWFRWSALATVVLGLLLAELQRPTSGYGVAEALALDDDHRTIGIGMWLGLIMAANVWFIIWPNQKKALGIVAAADDVKARAASMAMMASRTNLILSIPMLYCMVGKMHIG